MFLVNYDPSIIEIYPLNQIRKLFNSFEITTDINKLILINNDSSDILHIIDQHRNYLRYVECNGGLSIDSEQNLEPGHQESGKFKLSNLLQLKHEFVSGKKKIET